MATQFSECPVCKRQIVAEFLRRHLGLKHPTFDLRTVK